jgi:hypothetical protein
MIPFGFFNVIRRDTPEHLFCQTYSFLHRQPPQPAYPFTLRLGKPALVQQALVAFGFFHCFMIISFNADCNELPLL